MIAHLCSSFRHVFMFFALLASLCGQRVAAGEPAEVAQQILEHTGVRGGFIVHLGCGDGRLTAALHANSGFQVHGLDWDPANVEAARAFIYKQGVYGEVSVDRIEGTHLPYIDNLVNLLVCKDLNGVSIDEIKRVLVPGGVALVKDGEWRKVEKPRPGEIDDWTHYYYDSRGNAVSKDSVVAPPERLQWVGSPRWSRHHDRMSSLSAMVSSRGRLFYIMDEGSRASILLPSKWVLTARDAFNGTILWRQPIEKWQSQLWPLKSGPTQLARRLVASEDRIYVTLSIEAPISCVDGATGKVLKVYEETKGAEEILFCNGVLYALVNPKAWALTDFAPKFNTGDQKRVETEFNWDQQPRELIAVDAANGKVLWKKDSAKVAPLTLATDGKRLVYYDGGKIVELDPASGVEHWASVHEPKRNLFEYNYGPRLLLNGNEALYAGGDGSMKALDADSGKELWSAPHSKSGYRSPEDLIVTGGLVWNAPTSSGAMSGAFSGRDLLSGAIKVEFPPDVNTYWFHHRCYIAKATERFILPSRTGVEFVDYNAKHWQINHWVRGACLYGVLPCNGLLYAGPHDCACYAEAKIFGMNALAPALTAPLPPPLTDEQRLEKGPAYAGPLVETGADEKDWPMYRHDPARSGSTSQALNDDLGKSWELELGGKLSALIIAAGKLFVAQVEQHTLHALDASTGKALWRFTAGGRVDSPPTYWKGRVLFGSADGSVYCLRAEDGALIWRFHAAPLDRRHFAFEQLESVWPVPGSVLVEDGVASFVAGRSVFLDGGLRFIRLDAATGKKVVETVFDNKDPETGKDLQTRLRTLQMPVGLNDILSSDGKFIYLRSQKINASGQRVEIGPVSGNAIEQGAAQKGEGAHVFAPMGFTDDSWFHRSYWVFGKNFAGGHNGYFQAGKYAPSGRMLVFDDKNVYSYGREPQYFKWTTTMEHQLCAASKEPPDVAPQLETGKAGAKGKAAAPTGPYVRFPDSDKLDPSNKALTVMAWVSPDNKDGVVLSHGGGTNGYALALQEGRPGFSVCTADRSETAAAARPLDEGWHHLAGVLTAEKKLRLYVDGELAAETNAPGLIAKKPKIRLQLGACGNSRVSEYGHGAPYTGLLDQLAIYHSALSEEDISEHQRDTAFKLEPSLVLACSFDNGDARDESGNKLDGISEGVETGKGKVGKALRFRKSDNAVAADKTAPASKGSFVQTQWARPVSVLTRAMAMAGGTLLVAGPPDVVNEEYAFERLSHKDPSIQASLEKQDAALQDKEGANLLAYSTSGDNLGKDFDLESTPVWDGMIVAQGCIFISSANGKVTCYGKLKK